MISLVSVMWFVNSTVPGRSVNEPSVERSRLSSTLAYFGDMFRSVSVTLRPPSKLLTVLICNRSVAFVLPALVLLLSRYTMALLHLTNLVVHALHLNRLDQLSRHPIGLLTKHLHDSVPLLCSECYADLIVWVHGRGTTVNAPLLRSSISAGSEGNRGSSSTGCCAKPDF